MLHLVQDGVCFVWGAQQTASHGQFSAAFIGTDLCCPLHSSKAEAANTLCDLNYLISSHKLGDMDLINLGTTWSLLCSDFKLKLWPTTRVNLTVRCASQISQCRDFIAGHF